MEIQFTIKFTTFISAPHTELYIVYYTIKAIRNKCIDKIYAEEYLGIIKQKLRILISSILQNVNSVSRIESGIFIMSIRKNQCQRF